MTGASPIRRLRRHIFARRPSYTACYGQIMAAARRPMLYADGAAPDTLDGRFDMLVAHLYLVLRRLRHAGEAEIGQALFDLFCEDMDTALRAQGVGDTRVGRKMRDVAAAFYGRAAAYDKAFASKKPRAALAAVLARNLYPDHRAKRAPLIALADALIAMEAALAECEIATIIAGTFPMPPKRV